MLDKEEDAWGRVFQAEGAASAKSLRWAHLGA